MATTKLPQWLATAVLTFVVAGTVGLIGDRILFEGWRGKIDTELRAVQARMQALESWESERRGIEVRFEKMEDQINRILTVVEKIVLK